MDDGQRAAVQEEMLALLPRLHRFACALTGSVDAGDDLLQTTCEKALRSLHQWEPGTRLDSWLFRIARNSHLNDLRARKVRGVHLELQPLEEVLPGRDGERDGIAKVEFKAVRAMIARLPEEQRAVLLLVAVEGFSYAEAARVLDLPIGTVTSRLGRARIALNECFKGDKRLKTALGKG